MESKLWVNSIPDYGTRNRLQEEISGKQLENVEIKFCPTKQDSSQRSQIVGVTIVPIGSNSNGIAQSIKEQRPAVLQIKLIDRYTFNRFFI